MSSNSQYETYEAPPAYGGLDAPPGDLHSAETLAYGVGAYGQVYADTYQPAYEGDDWRAPDEGALAPVVHAGVGRRGARRRKTRYAGSADGSMRRLLPQALVVAFLAGGTSAFVAKDKAIELSVDGRPRTLHTFADDVSELLAQEGVELGAHDVVAPAPGTELSSGDEIEVRYGRPVRLTLDGVRHEVWTTARTVDEALEEWGVRAEGAYLSAARSLRIGRAGLALDVRTERSVTVMADGRARTVRTNAASVGEVVEEAGITLRGQDTTSVPLGSFPRDGQTVTVLRITGTKEVREEEIPFDVRRTEDPALFRGTEVVERAGQPGLRRATYSLRTVNGVRQKPRRIRTEIVREPRTQLVKVGTRPMPASVRGADGLNWQGLAACESGGRANAVDPSGTYGGLYQFDTRTWRSLGGSGRPQDAPAAEQTLRAKKLYVQRGASPWPHCGARLHG
ncbi:transglycosylase domain-containing protein [Streptomyces davaonensis JCM 4913]|uniref:Transglycosylase domain-containing protein n=1 Tax=Streptomyces davaonensis (strain DSM 101723 / JCM 4913 / KCC S-0913 / 768) TaxID=1214101 RepID=K4QZM7_STRDJ|nr:resuscitation-promoting factor [Streptomyces davaonensis]CCK29506.1 transglycosylase domain-containing protein [Streptomyces davaonensis JCM 4913]